MKAMRCGLLMGLLLNLTACRSQVSQATPTRQQAQQSQQEVEAVELMALHKNRDIVFSHRTQLGGYSEWDKSVPGMQIWDCSLAIIGKHNQQYPKSPWELEGIAARDRLFGPPEGDRKVMANACAERSIKEAQALMDDSNAFQKR